MRKKLLALLAAAALLLALPLAGCLTDDAISGLGSPADPVSLSEVPAWSGEPSIEIDGNTPSFTAEELATPFGTEEYGALDRMGRCTYAFACAGEETMPSEPRGDIHEIHPTGWKQEFYDFIEGEALYNRCHLIAHSLTAENANERNLITGTRYLNATAMLPYEESICNYIWQTGNHVIYRVTPIFEGSNLLASGVQMEAQSVEDNGRGICFNVYCYNVQPGVVIDYATGANHLAEGSTPESGYTYNQPSGMQPVDTVGTYVLNTSSMRFHLPSCDGATSMQASNRQNYTGSRQALIDEGYEPCGRCNP